MSWPLALGLGVFALVRPLTRIVASQFEVAVPSAVPLALTAAITLVWAAVVGFSEHAAPVLTLVCAGVAYAALSIILSGILSPVLDGELAGPIANPAAIVPFVLLNAGWGLVTGALALLVRRARTAS